MPSSRCLALLLLLVSPRALLSAQDDRGGGTIVPVVDTTPAGARKALAVACGAASFEALEAALRTTEESVFDAYANIIEDPADDYEAEDFDSIAKQEGDTF